MPKVDVKAVVYICWNVLYKEVVNSKNAFKKVALFLMFNNKFYSRVNWYLALGKNMCIIILWNKSETKKQKYDDNKFMKYIP